MNPERRKFLHQMVAMCGAGAARTLGVGMGAGTLAVASSSQVAAAAGTATAAVTYGSGVRAQVFEIIVRQGMAGAPWELICEGPMKINGISAEEIKAEIARRRSPVHSERPELHLPQVRLVALGPLQQRPCESQQHRSFTGLALRLCRLPRGRRGNTAKVLAR